jgi:hypothetical protein
MHTLKFKTKDEVPSELAKDAVEKDGVWIVKVEPAGKVAEFRENNIALSKELDALKTQMKELDKLQDGDDLDVAALVAEIAELREIKQKVDDGKLKADDKIEAELETRTKKFKESYEAKLAEHKQQLELLKEKLSSAENTIKESRFEREIDNLIAREELGLNPVAKRAIIAEARSFYSYDDDGNLVPRDPATGDKLWGADGKSPLTMDEWVNSHLKKNASYVFKSDQRETNPLREGGFTKAEIKDMSTDDLWAAATAQEKL